MSSSAFDFTRFNLFFDFLDYLFDLAGISLSEEEEKVPLEKTPPTPLTEYSSSKQDRFVPFDFCLRCRAELKV